MAVIVSGPVLASVLYGQADCPGDQEGLLIGQVTHSVTDTISDSQINNYKKETKIYIYSCNVLPRDKAQRRKDQILQCMTEQTKTLGQSCMVGWYRSRRNTNLRVSMMERSIHQSLLKALPEDRREEFYFLLCTASQTPNGSTHNLDFGFYKFSKISGSFQKVPVSVVNLGDTTHNQYKFSTCCTVSPTSGIYASTTAAYEREMLDKSGSVMEVGKVSGLASTLQSKLQGLTQHVLDSECQVQKLEAEVKRRQEKINDKLKQQQESKPLPPSPPPAYTDRTPPLTPESLQSNKHTEEAISVAKQKREQRRREAKALYPNVQPGRHTSAKSKIDASSPHTRRLSAEIDEYQSGSHARKLSDDIAFIDEDVSDDTEHVRKTDVNDSVAGNKSLTSDKNTERSQVCTSSSEVSENAKSVLQPQALETQDTGEKWIPPSFSKTVPQTKNPVENEDTGGKGSDHFAFVSGLLAQEKTKSPPRQDSGSFNASENSVVLPVGKQVKLPLLSKSFVPVKLNNDKVVDQKVTRSQKLQQHAELSSSTHKRIQTRSGQAYNQTNGSKSSTGKDSSNCVESVRFSEGDGSHKSSNHGPDTETASGNNCRFQASSERQNYELDGDKDVNMKTVTEPAQLDSFCASSSPVF